MAFQSLDTIIDFLEPVNTFLLSDDEGYHDSQLGKHIAVYETHFPDIAEADLVLVGAAESRGGGVFTKDISGPDAIRKQFYSLFQWHANLKLADVGNVKEGASLQDSYAALKAVVSELLQQGKRVVILGGSHDLATAQYEVYADLQKVVDTVCIDAKIDLHLDSTLPGDIFLMKMLTSEPNFIKHYSHIGFQSYLVHPQMLETIDKLGFDCFRVGKVKEAIEEMEPVIRNVDFFSFDISAIAHAFAPANHATPNGFNGEEACTLMQYAGMATNLKSMGIYGYVPEQDTEALTAKQISHMLWYLMDGMYKGKQEAALEDKDLFREFHLAFADFETVFIQSRKTGRWWMQLPEGKYIACSYKDYLLAANNEIPERWIRAVERS